MSVKRPSEAAARRKWRAENPERYKAYRRKYRAENRERIVAQGRKLRESNPTRYREYHLRAVYGISVTQFEELKAKQSGRCTCGDAPKTLHVDHDHETGVVRGLLCGSCNRALGLLKEDPARIRALAAYVEKFYQPK